MTPSSSPTAATYETTFSVPKMDCPSEERVIRMTLGDADMIRSLTFDLAARRLVVIHTGDAEVVLRLLEPLGFGAARLATRGIEAGIAETKGVPRSKEDEARVLWQLLTLNAIMFVVELAAGIVAGSVGLIADSLDMFADAGVYGLSLYTVGKTKHHQRRAARVSGYLELALALGALSEVVRGFLHGSEPVSVMMMAFAFLALLVNTTCMLLLSKHREGGVHLKASWIFSTNDVLANLGVLLAGALVWVTGSRYPDLAIGTLIGFLVLAGALRILKLSRA
jgi:Co/Zn/Cd efflux system component